MSLPLVVLVLIAPVFLLAAAVVGLAEHGPLGWLAAAGLLVLVAALVRAAARRSWAWWVSTKAPVRGVSGGTGPDAAGPAGPPGGRSPG